MKYLILALSLVAVPALAHDAPKAHDQGVHRGPPPVVQQHRDPVQNDRAGSAPADRGWFHHNRGHHRDWLHWRHHRWHD